MPRLTFVQGKRLTRWADIEGSFKLLGMLGLAKARPNEEIQLLAAAVKKGFPVAQLLDDANTLMLVCPEWCPQLARLCSPCSWIFACSFYSFRF